MEEALHEERSDAEDYTINDRAERIARTHPMIITANDVVVSSFPISG